MYNTGLSPTMIIIIVVVAVFLLVVLPIIIMAGKGGRKNWQNKIMQPYIDEYKRLAEKVQAPPPEQPEYNGYKGWPILKVTKGNAEISVTPNTHYELSTEKEFLYRDPYTEMSQQNRMMAAATAQAVNSLLGSSKHHSYAKQEANQVTEIRMKMPFQLQGSKILITPETIAGKIFSIGEIKIDYPEMDKTFNIRGGNPAVVQQFLNPSVCDALLKFRKAHGRFQLNENEMVWIKMGFKTFDLPPVIEGLVEVSKALWKS